MKTNYSKINNLLFIFLALPLIIYSQKTDSMWKNSSKIDSPASEKVFRKTEPKVATFYQLDLETLKNSLNDTPKRGSSSQSNVVVDFPSVDGKLYSYRVMEASILHPDLQEKYPNIRSYVGHGIENPSVIIRFSVTPQGLHGMLLSTDQGTQYIDPYSKNGNDYILYTKKSLPTLDESFICGFEDEVIVDSGKETTSFKNADDGQLRTFRLALASTIEYSSFHWMAAGLTAGDTEAAKKTAVLAAMNVTMTRVNGVFENDLAITMVIVPSNENVIFIDTDSFSNDNANSLINESQTVINAIIGSPNYDIGHTFSTGGGGLASLNSPCTGFKAQGITGSPAPVGDPYDIDYVAHEMGHQFGAPHTFNGDTQNCAGTNRSPSNAYEVGSGSTIMAYAGICAPQNVQSNSDAYFHQKSIQMIWDNITPGGAVSNSTCGVQTPLTLNPNVPTANAGGDYTIPISTPYMLTGSSTDDDGTGSHTFTWEQFDLGPSGIPTETTATGPLVRSFEGTTSPTRFIPRMQDLLLAPGSTEWEKLASINRDIKFILTVRDNGIGGGQTAIDEMDITVSNTSGPFAVTSQSALTTWTESTTETITWEVAGTNTGAVNTPNVDILFSTDGGLTYPTVLASSVPNDGSHDITVPNISAENCRVLVKGTDNIFFNINTAQIAIGYTITITTNCNTYTTGSIATGIPDSTGTDVQGSPVFIPVSVTETLPITDIKISADVTHSNIGDLIMQLQAPNGLGFQNIWSRNCNNGTFGDVDITFKDGEPTIVCASPTTGTYAPANPMTAFNGGDPSGTWNLVFVDFNIGNAGTVNEWSVELCTTTTTTTALSVEENNFALFNVFPNPSNGTVNISLSSIDDVQVSLYDIRGRLISSEKHPNNSGTFKKELNFGTVSSGVYLLNVKSGNKTATKKLIIK